MKNAKSRFESASNAGRTPKGTARTTFGILSALLVLALAHGASSASAAFVHNTVAASFGSDGTSASSIGGINQLAFNQTSDRLYALGTSPSRVYGFDTSTPGAYTPVGGSFPLTVASAGGEPDLAVDSTSGNIHFLSEESGLYGFSSIGTQLFTVPKASNFNDPCGAAVDPAGNVWVGDYASQSIKKYSPSGTAEGSVSVAIQEHPCHVAFDSNGDMYVARYSGYTWKYTAASGYTSATEVDSGAATGLTVDRTSHNVYIVHSGNVTVYNASGTQLEVFATAIGNLRGVAVDDSAGTVYVSDGTIGKIRVLPGVVIPDVTTGDVAGTTVSGHVDPVGGGDVTSCVVEYRTDAESSYENSVPCQPTIPPSYSVPTDISATLPGLTGETLYHYRVVAANANGTSYGSDRTFTPHFVEDLTTEPATNLGKNSATLNASFVGNGEGTDYYFEWGLDGVPYEHVTAAPPGDDAGSGLGPQAVSFNLSGLSSDSTYHYRVVATNGKGFSVAQERTFSTLFAVLDLTTGTATNLKAESATLNGSWTGDGSDTHYYFEWGFGTLYGHTTPGLPGADGGSAVGPQSQSVGIAGLVPNATYHYRILASNPSGTSIGIDKTFKTPKLPSTKSRPTTDFASDSVTLHAVVNPEGSGDTTYHFEYGTDTNYGSSTPESAPVGSDGTDYSASAELSGLSPGTIYHFRIVATSPSGFVQGPDQTFTTISNLPTIGDTFTSGQAPSTVTLNAQVRPGFGPTLAYFEYGLSSAYGLQTIPGGSIGSDDAEHLVSVGLSGLLPGTTYHYRVVAINFAGGAHSTDRIFTTSGLPGVNGGTASNVSQTEATLSAQVNPSLADTTYRFEYGTGDSYGLSTPESRSLGAGNTTRPVTATIAGLSPATTYHFRILASNVVGTTTGQDGTFTTPAALGKSTQPPRKCKRGFLKRAGKCVKKPRHRKNRRHRHASRSHG